MNMPSVNKEAARGEHMRARKIKLGSRHDIYGQVVFRGIHMHSNPVNGIHITTIGASRQPMIQAAKAVWGLHEREDRSLVLSATLPRGKR